MKIFADRVLVGLEQTSGNRNTTYNIWKHDEFIRSWTRNSIFWQFGIRTLAHSLQTLRKNHSTLHRIKKTHFVYENNVIFYKNKRTPWEQFVERHAIGHKGFTLPLFLGSNRRCFVNDTFALMFILLTHYYTGYCDVFVSSNWTRRKITTTTAS